MKSFVIGDIHGGLKALKQVLSKGQIDARDQLIFLGDYVDGWSESKETIDYLLALDEEYSCVFLRGNHDDLVLQWLRGQQKNDTWLKHGGHSTELSYRGISPENLERHITFYKNLRDFYINADEQLFLHAGFTNMHGPSFEYHSTPFYWDRTLWEMALALNPNLTPSDSRYPKRLKHFNEIFIGHTPVVQIGETTPVKAGNIWNVDTGAAFKGPLSLMDISSKELFQSDPVYQLYPDEDGRN